ncbi:energy transducer TonB [Acidovorax sp. Root219]|uniref:energy transducer TonB n=1 Tax=Acidovorax sp. Root219 TaxID=1736493 RepID=UPI0009E9057F|nr:energy transducer TonB [Acidovorax sp. Root219]
MQLHRCLLLCTLVLASGLTAAQGIANPAATPSIAAGPARNEPPDYPPISLRNGEEGLVEVRVLVDNQGVPLKAEVKRSSGFPRLDTSARQATMRWRYQPGTAGTGLEPTWMVVPINFVLEGPSPAPSK